MTYPSTPTENDQTPLKSGELRQLLPKEFVQHSFECLSGQGRRKVDERALRPGNGDRTESRHIRLVERAEVRRDACRPHAPRRPEMHFLRGARRQPKIGGRCVRCERPLSRRQASTRPNVTGYPAKAYARGDSRNQRPDVIRRYTIEGSPPALRTWSSEKTPCCFAATPANAASMRSDVTRSRTAPSMDTWTINEITNRQNRTRAHSVDFVSPTYPAPHDRVLPARRADASARSATGAPGRAAARADPPDLQPADHVLPGQAPGRRDRTGRHQVGRRHAEDPTHGEARAAGRRGGSPAARTAARRCLSASGCPRPRARPVARP